ncbi:Ribosomal protein S2, conserved site [Penicillium digitatum]|uniref:Ribosomal protein S2, conserved site n=1 Tax=Penicillium digitatum TaxID=36651 RepID=A0A7T7BL90_PENDI|nr:Ribosomal protein S2, conserved site [Penicillium digitatum]
MEMTGKAQVLRRSVRRFPGAQLRTMQRFTQIVCPMRHSKRLPYGAVAVEENHSSSRSSSEFQDYTTIEFPEVDEQKPQPQLLKRSQLDRIFRLLWDMILAIVAFLFALFGILVSWMDGKPAGPESVGSKLFEVSRFAPTVFPVLFAAIAGSSIKSLASWRIQTTGGATIGLVEQCLGSQTITGAFLTQIRLRTMNFVAVFIVLLWCLSPLGSQASLRIISIVPSYPANPIELTSFNTFTAYQFGYSQVMSMAKTSVAIPMTASMSAASLLSTRNQDLWGNIRFPAIENLEKTSTGWMHVPQNDNLTYASLVGVPVIGLPSAGNTSFILPGSYLSISCPVFDTIHTLNLTDFAGPDAPSPGNGDDCSWTSAWGGFQFQLALSEPCSNALNASKTRTRNARKLIWESWDRGYADDVRDRSPITRAICDITTTYVDANVTCESLDGKQSVKTCDLLAARRSVDRSHFHQNWTVFDINPPGNFQLMKGYNNGVFDLLTTMFPHMDENGGLQPVIGYFIDPFQAIGTFFSETLMSPETTTSSVFGTRLSQLLNSLLYLGINPSTFTGSVDMMQFTREGSTIKDTPFKVTAQTTHLRNIVRCHRPWLAVLIVSSVVIFSIAVMAAYLHIKTIAPDLLGSISVALLQNKTDGIIGSSIWTSDEWTKNMRDKKLWLGDVQPGAEIGRLALTTVAQDFPLGSRKESSLSDH